MSTTYNVQAGDTFDSISRKQYGTGDGAGRIESANPGAVLTPGASLLIPAAPTQSADSAPSDSDEAAIRINGERFKYWGEVSLHRSMDSVDRAAVSAPFEPDNAAIKSSFKPFAYAPIEVLVGGETLFSGAMVGVEPALDNTQNTVSANCYSLPGVLNDCTPPASAFPLEFSGQTLREIAAKLCDPFGLDVVFDSPPGAPFTRVAIEPGEKVLSFLVKLATQRGLILTNNAAGALVFYKEVAAGAPVARLKQGGSPVLSVSPAFAPQQYHSHVTGVEPADIGTKGAQFTVKNPHASAVRPLTYLSGDVLGAELSESVRAKAGRMFANAVVYTVEVSTWRAPGGALWSPNTTITLEAPRAMIYKPYEFTIRAVEFNRATDSRATLTLIIPGTFSGQIPEALPWDE